MVTLCSEGRYVTQQRVPSRHSSQNHAWPMGAGCLLFHWFDTQTDMLITAHADQLLLWCIRVLTTVDARQRNALPNRNRPVCFVI